MYDRGLSVLEQYGLEAGAVYRGRGALICETQEGLVLIREFCGTPRKLEYQAKLLEKISGTSPIWTDQILSNKEGSYISGDSENIPYIVKKWYEGKECDTRSEGEICKGVSALASLHKTMYMPVQNHYVRESLCSEFQRHNRELRKIRKFILGKRRKNPFEQELLDTICSFLGHGEEALERLESSEYEKLRQQELARGAVCHGEFNQHNILFSEGKVRAVTNFDKWNFDIQVGDLYRFMRKILEKHQWDLDLGRKLLLAYQQVRPLSREEVENLRIRFAYPEKYWKLANYYYTHNKAWISEKNLEKLEKLREQKDKWRNFVESVFVA